MTCGIVLQQGHQNASTIFASPKHNKEFGEAIDLLSAAVEGGNASIAITAPIDTLLLLEGLPTRASQAKGGRGRIPKPTGICFMPIAAFDVTLASATTPPLSSGAAQDLLAASNTITTELQQMGSLVQVAIKRPELAKLAVLTKELSWRNKQPSGQGKKSDVLLLVSSTGSFLPNVMDQGVTSSDSDDAKLKVTIGGGAMATVPLHNVVPRKVVVGIKKRSDVGSKISG